MINAWARASPSLDESNRDKVFMPEQYTKFFRIASLILALVLAQAVGTPIWAGPYQAQAPQADFGDVKLELSGPGKYVRIDGLDQDVDRILLATQSPAAAVLAIYAEPAAWQNFQKGQQKKDQTGLACHALISTPAAMAGQVVSVDDFGQIKKSMLDSLRANVGRIHQLDGELGAVSDHQVEKAIGKIESFVVVEEDPSYVVYRQESSLEMTLKGARPKISRSTTVTATLLAAGKIINLQIVASPEGPKAGVMEKETLTWLKSFSKGQTN